MNNNSNQEITNNKLEEKKEIVKEIGRAHV